MKSTSEKMGHLDMSEYVIKENSPLLDDLIKLLQPYDAADLLASAAALQICPQNADKVIRLDALTHAIASLSHQSEKQRISQHRLMQLCNNPPLGKGQIQSHEDPAEQAFTEAFTFTGGSYVVFPGAIPDATFILKHLNRAIFLGAY